MDLHQIIYSSRPFGYDEAMLAGILLDARRCNARDDVTGALICREDVYLQLLEGPKDTVLATLDRIAKDDRHADIVLHMSGRIFQRMFAQWEMLHDPAFSWLTPGQAPQAGDLDRIRNTNVRAIFEKLARAQAA
ncbi:MAG: BLUF domain-containing protein [Pseudomonadota bacterium]